MDPGRAGAPGSTAQIGTTSATRPANPFADANQDDIEALFGSLDNLGFADGHPTDSDHFPGLADAYSCPVPDRLAAHASLFGNGQQYGIQDPNVWEPLSMHHVNTAALPPPPINGLPHPRPPSRVATPAPWIVVPETQAPTLHQPSTPLPQPQPTRYTLVSQVQTGSPTGSPFSLRTPTSSCPRPRLSTRELVSQARSQARSPHLPIPPPPANLPGTSNLRARSSLDPDDALPFGLAHLRLSLNSGGAGDNTDDAISEDEERRLDPDASRPSTPVAFEDTDIGLDESSPVQVTQARSPRRIPTILEVKANARRLYKLHHRKHRRRHPTPAPETSRRRKRAVLRAGTLTAEQQMVMAPMEYHVFKDIVCKNPWPEDREEFLEAAEKYATNVTGISGPDVFTESFLDTVFYKMSANRGNSLTRIEVMMEQEFAVTTVDKPEIYQLLNKDQFLYPNVNRDPSQYFCIGALGAALEIILFKSPKTLGVAFIEEFCQLDDTEECARWHSKLRDRTARKGVSPGAIAFAATQMYWALEKMYLGTNIHFDEGHFRVVWDRYFRALIKLPHLGQLRVDLLDRLKEYYMDHWPSDERDDDDNSFPAW
ncbi:hypothetical protein FS749_009388 [Ceratobasidium sp. UAMH 11750]|nr:hypothetical protein FS749_009388 [Ceratobasidium sp. UAMH 11750]